MRKVGHRYRSWRYHRVMKRDDDQLPDSASQQASPDVRLLWAALQSMSNESLEGMLDWIERDARMGNATERNAARLLIATLLEQRPDVDGTISAKIEARLERDRAGAIILRRRSRR